MEPRDATFEQDREHETAWEAQGQGWGQGRGRTLGGAPGGGSGGVSGGGSRSVGGADGSDRVHDAWALMERAKAGVVIENKHSYPR